jgi:hypothetical protein
MAPGRQVKPITWISNERRGGTSSISKKKKARAQITLKKEAEIEMGGFDSSSSVLVVGLLLPLPRDRFHLAPPPMAG